MVEILKDYQEAQRYFEGKFQSLSRHYNFDEISINPCSVRNRDDLLKFTQDILEKLYWEEEYEILPTPVNSLSVDFLFNGIRNSFHISPQYKHIAPDFHKIIDFLGFLANKSICMINPSGPTVAGEQAEIKEAWKKGFPVHLDEIEFFRKTINNKYRKRELSKVKFKLSVPVSPEIFATRILKYLNSYFHDKQTELNDKQIKIYYGYKGSACTLFNGGYLGSFTIERNETIFDSSFLSQIFITDYIASNPAIKLFELKKDKIQSELKTTLAEHLRAYEKG